MKRLAIVSIFCCVSSIACSQPAPNVPVKPTEYTFRLKPEQVDLVGKALGKLPFEEVAEVVQSLRQQIVEQQQLMNAPKTLEKKK